MDDKNIDALIGNPKNPRQISKHDFAALKKSIVEFGDLSGIIFNITTQHLVGGHQRTEAFKRIGGKPKISITQKFDPATKDGTVAIGYVIHDGKQYGYREVAWPLERELAANIAANRISGEWDLDLLAEANYYLYENDKDLLALTGQTEDEISRLLDAVGVGGDPAEDEAPAVDEQNPPVSQLDEIYQLGQHRLMCGDSTDFGALSDLMDGQIADMVFTDPPYGVSYQSNMRTQSEKFDVIKNDDKLIGEWIEPVLAISTGFIFIWTSWKVIAEWLDLTKPIGSMTNMVIWDKGGGGIGDLQGTFASDYEVALVFNRGAKLTGERLGSVWSVGKDSSSLYEHPTQKPVALAETALKTTTLRDHKVLDVFGGSGSTLIACEKLGRTCYMMELDPKYVDVIRKRYAKHIGKDTEWQTATPAIQTAGQPQ